MTLVFGGEIAVVPLGSMVQARVATVYLATAKRTVFMAYRQAPTTLLFGAKIPVPASECMPLALAVQACMQRAKQTLRSSKEVS